MKQTENMSMLPTMEEVKAKPGVQELKAIPLIEKDDALIARLAEKD